MKATQTIDVSAACGCHITEINEIVRLMIDQARAEERAAANAAVERAANHFRAHGYDEINLRRMLTVEIDPSLT